MIDVKEYLKQIKKLDDDLDDKLTELYRAERANRTNVERLRVEANELQDKFIAYRDEATRCINQLDDSKQINIIRLKYIKFCTYDEIASTLNYSKSQVKRIHNKALCKLNNILCAKNQ